MKWSILAGFIFFGSMASANLEVTCVAESCLTEGWHTYDQRTGDSGLTICKNNDCLLSGWQNTFKGNISAEVVCKPQGCFTQGWQVFDGFRRLIADVTCQNSFAGSNCLRNGWTTYEVGRGSYLTRCVNADCEYQGWDLIVNGYVPQATRCKQGGCFTVGWIVYQ